MPKPASVDGSNLHLRATTWHIWVSSGAGIQRFLPSVRDPSVCPSAVAFSVRGHGRRSVNQLPPRLLDHHTIAKANHPSGSRGHHPGRHRLPRVPDREIGVVVLFVGVRLPGVVAHAAAQADVRPVAEPAVIADDAGDRELERLHRHRRRDSAAGTAGEQ